MNDATINDKDLILYYYRDGLEPEERSRIEAAVASDPELRGRYAELRRSLDALDERPPPAPAAAVSRWHNSIDRAAASEQTARVTPLRRFRMAPFAWGSVVAAALALGIGIGLYFPRGHAPAGTPASTLADDNGPPVSTTGSGAFLRGLQAHFVASRRDLDDVVLQDEATRRELILQLVQQNRLFARAAADNDSPDLARVLRAFEPVLLEMAAEDLAPEEARRLQDKLDFELNVMLTKMIQASSDRSKSI